MQAWGSLHQWQQLGLGLGHDLEDVRGCLPTERENPCQNWQDHQLSLSPLAAVGLPYHEGWPSAGHSQRNDII